MFRWVVEAVNSRIKGVFPFFKHTIEGTYVPKIMRFYRIACAILNKYFPPLCSDQDFHNIIFETIKNQTSQTNSLKAEIDQLGIQRLTTRWVKATEKSVPNFPQLTMEDLKRITLGTYQLKIAEQYIKHHIKEDSNFGIFIHRENKNIIRAKIQSRFSRLKTHNTFVKFDENISGFEGILGLYCTCKVGERTLGCCSHLAAIVRYLGYEIHQPPTISRSSFRSQWNAIDCSLQDANDSSEDEDDEEE